MKEESSVTIAAFSKSEIISSVFMIIIYLVGIAGISLGFTHDLFIQLIPYVIILSLVVSLAFHRGVFELKLASIFILIVLASWLVEAIGVNTGIIFGNYSYGESLGIKIAHTPLLIGLNWFLLVYGSAAIADIFAMRPVTGIFAASSLMVLYDLILEPVAPLLGMWQFIDGAAPLKNYVAWFLLAFVFHSLLKFSGIKIINRVAPLIFIVQLLFFLLLMIIFRLL